MWGYSSASLIASDVYNNSADDKVDTSADDKVDVEPRFPASGAVRARSSHCVVRLPQGGGAYIGASSTANFINCTIRGNTADKVSLCSGRPAEPRCG